MHSNRFLLILVLLPILLLAACAAPTATTVPTATAVAIATVVPTDIPVQVTATTAPTATKQPSLTPAATATLAATETALPTATPPPTPDSALSNVKVIGLAWYPNYDLLLSFQFSEPVDPQKYRVTLEDKEYKCEVIAQYANRLYCRGQGAKVLAKARARIYPAGSDEPGFEKDVWVPYFP